MTAHQCLTHKSSLPSCPPLTQDPSVLLPQSASRGCRQGPCRPKLLTAQRRGVHSGLPDLGPVPGPTALLQAGRPGPLARGRKKPVPGPGTGRQGECSRGQDDSASCCGKGRTAGTDNSQAGRMRFLQGCRWGLGSMEPLDMAALRPWCTHGHQGACPLKLEHLFQRNNRV